jgi:hypothetical protein
MRFREYTAGKYSEMVSKMQKKNWKPYECKEVRFGTGNAMAQAVSRRPFTAEAQFRHFS